MRFGKFIKVFGVIVASSLCITACASWPVPGTHRSDVSVVDIVPSQSDCAIKGATMDFVSAPASTGSGRLLTTWLRQCAAQSSGTAQTTLSVVTALPRRFLTWSSPVTIMSTAGAVGPDVSAVYDHPVMLWQTVTEQGKSESFLRFFWTRIYYRRDEGAQAVTNYTKPLSLSAVGDAQTWRWQYVPKLHGGVAVRFALPPRQTWTAIVRKRQADTWPLKDNRFDPTDFSQVPEMTTADKLAIANQLEQRLARRIGNDNFDAIKTALHRQDQTEHTTDGAQDDTADLGGFGKAMTNYQALSSLLHESAGHLNAKKLDDLLTLLYRLYDAEVIVRMNDTMLNPDGKYYRLGWQTASHPMLVTLADGRRRLLLPLYAPELGLSLVIYSDDGGKQWHAPAMPIIGRGAGAPALVVLGQGTNLRIVAYLRNAGDELNLNRLLTGESDDGGKTWHHVRPSRALINDNNGFAAIALHDGTLRNAVAMAYGDKHGIYLAVSRDDGVSWTRRLMARAVQGETLQVKSMVQGVAGALYVLLARDRPPQACGGQASEGRCHGLAVMTVRKV